MREKKLWLIITFNSTTDAIRMEKYCHQNKIEGRLIPVPRMISASCGMCWRTAPENREQIEADFKNAGLNFSGIYKIVM